MIPLNTLVETCARFVPQMMFVKARSPFVAACIPSMFFTDCKEYPLDALPFGAFFLENHGSRETLIAAATQLR
jgi:hypothetical protein